MKTSFGIKYVPYNPTQTVYEFLTEQLDGEDYERGALEEVAAEANNVKNAFARLCAVLNDKAIISDQDIFFIGKNYRPKDE